MSVHAISPKDHVVQFYDDEDQLAVAVGRHLLEGLLQGEVAVIMASPDHRSLFEAHLCRSGLDVESARTEGKYVELDAAAALASFMVDDVPDPSRFDAAIGGVLRSALTQGPVRAYGEMVALLWADGLIPGAMDLEALWNDLGRRLPFSLFCAYPAEAMTLDAPFERVCQLHSEVLGSGSRRGPAYPVHEENVRSRSFECALDAPRAARMFVADVLGSWGEVDRIDGARVIVTELTANAVVHARTGFTVTVERTPQSLKISVEDGAPEVPWPRAPLASAPSGRGMHLVHSLADAWGTELSPGGKTVWAHLRREVRVPRGDSLWRPG